MLDCMLNALRKISTDKFIGDNIKQRLDVKLEIHSVEHGICPIAEFTSPLLSCAAILAIRP